MPCHAKLLAALLLAGAVHAAEPARALVSGIDTQYIDDSVRPQDDFYQHVNGKWLASTPIPADKAIYGSRVVMQDVTQERLRGIIEGLQRGVDAHDPDQQKLVDLYDSFMDEAGIERLGLRPVGREFDQIASTYTRKGVVRLIAHFNEIGVTAPVRVDIHQDARDSSRYVVDLVQSGLGMPNRDYYLKDDERLAKVRAQYLTYIEQMLDLAGVRSAAHDATRILALETQLARLQWTAVENRDPVKTYNRVELSKLPALAPQISWPAYLEATGLQGRVDYLVISQPSFITGLGQLLHDTPVSTWRAYFRWRLLNDMAPYLGSRFVAPRFAFYGAALRGVEQDQPRWKRAVALLNQQLGEALGRLYVAQYFPPQDKAHIEALVANLFAAYRADIDTLQWMGPQTRARAQAKLAQYSVKLAYPEKWRDYSALRVERGDLLGNVLRSNEFEFRREIAKLGQPIDRGEWGMPPQTINAYYNPERNEIVFPAAYLQPPLFNPQADDAVNYGAIGSTIGHEISHGFDDSGSQYDGQGNLLTAPGWFTAEDLEQFKARTRMLVEQYSAYSPVPGYPINGELTLGENIADNSGVAIAYKAYQLSLGGRGAPIIDGLSGDQRFFMGWAQKWRGKVRENLAIMYIKIDPHSPDAIRGRVPEMNNPAFYAAFDVRPGDGMYLPPEKRFSLW